MLWTPSRGDQDRGSAARDLRRGDDHVLLAGVLGQRLADLLVLLVGERAGVAALVLGVGDEVELERASTERGDLLPGGAADVEAADDGAEALGGGDRLQAGDAGAEDQDPRGLHRAGGRGHHREEAAGLAGGEKCGGVAGDVGLRGERVHRLGAGDPRDRLDGEAGDAAGGERLRRVLGGERGEEADQDLALADLADLLGGRDRDAEHDVGAPCGRGVADVGAGLGEHLVGEAGLGACTGLDRDLDALGNERLDRIRDQGNAPLPLEGLLRNSNPHQRRRSLPERARVAPSAPAPGRRTQEGEPAPTISARRSIVWMRSP